MILRATKKPDTVEVMHWDGTITQLEKLMAWGAPVFLPTNSTERSIVIGTLEDGKSDGPQVQHIASVGDWIIKGVKGEFYPCKPEIFEKTYDIEGIPE